MDNMKPEDKVCSLEQAKRLVELGVVLDTERQWVEYDTAPPIDNPEYEWILCSHPINKRYSNIIPAPDVAELGELLYKIEPYLWHISPQPDGWYRSYITDSANGRELKTNYFETEAQARCAALNWLIENGHIKPESINV
jgi:hypothetical protein